MASPRDSGTVAFRTLGCRLNQAETDQMAEDLMQLGFEVVPESSDPDVVVINTCTVTQEATRTSRRMSRNAIRDHPDALVVVAGCYAVAEPQEAASIEGVGLIASNEDKERLAQIIGERLGVDTAPQNLLQIRPRPLHGRTRTNLKVQTGCDEFCTFCIIPHTRGSLRSYPLENLLDGARRKVEDGARELVLTGVHLGKYGWDTGDPDDALIALLEGLLEIAGLVRIRLSSILSRHVSPRLVGLMAAEPRLCRFLHIPLQSGDDSVLERMNRPYRIGEYLEVVDLVKSEIPEIGLTTDVIVGFPGETNEQFQRTLEVVDHVRYLKLHVFRYSARPGTPSASFPDQVDEPEKRRRSKELISLGNSLREEFHATQVGREVEVFVEETFDSGDVAGHTDNFVRVRFPAPPALAERLALVSVESASVESVTGRLVRPVAFADAHPRGK